MASLAICLATALKQRRCASAANKRAISRVIAPSPPRRKRAIGAVKQDTFRAIARKAVAAMAMALVAVIGDAAVVVPIIRVVVAERVTSAEAQDIWLEIALRVPSAMPVVNLDI